MKSLILTLALLVILQASSFARIGETVAECTNRYGQPLSHSTIATGEEYAFFKKPIGICVQLNNEGRVARIIYVQYKEYFKEYEIYELMKHNSGGRIAEWRNASGSDVEEGKTIYWGTFNGKKLFAIWYNYEEWDILEIAVAEFRKNVTKEFNNQNEIRQAIEASKKLQEL
ncbi:MAG: hypothetical protein L6437_05245 [Kiritimatiellae bacterium]|nr:hypothetical protein [Kiritimatiellia bacterium]